MKDRKRLSATHGPAAAKRLSARKRGPYVPPSDGRPKAWQFRWAYIPPGGPADQLRAAAATLKEAAERVMASFGVPPALAGRKEMADDAPLWLE